MHTIISSLKLKVNDLKNKNASDQYIRVAIKEELQNYILSAIYSNTKTDSLIFIGGTCLRKLYKLDRLSEDLDFDNPKKVSFEDIAQEVLDSFKIMKFDSFQYTIQKGKLISRLTFKFPILFELGLAPMPNENLHIKIESSNSDVGIFSYVSTPFMFDNFSFVVKNYDLPTMMAGKIAACIDRVYKKSETVILIKGRDFYDLIWYMQKNIAPNIEKLKYLNIAQSKDEVWEKLDEKISKIRSEDIYYDLQIFVENAKYAKDWSDNFHSFYKEFRKNY